MDGFPQPPSECPYCKAAPGFLMTVTFQQGHRTASYTCCMCLHVWIVTTPDDGESPPIPHSVGSRLRTRIGSKRLWSMVQRLASHSG